MRQVPRFDGYPCEWIADAGRQRVAGATLACCFMQRKAFLALTDPEPAYMNADVKEALLWRRAQEQGLESLWVSEVAMTALDDERVERVEHWQTCSEIVDCWNLSAELAAARLEDATQVSLELEEVGS